jgi:hypothetical protein
MVEGRGAESVDASYAFLAFVTDGYFKSKNCFRELLRAMCMKTKILVMFESEVGKHGGISLEEALKQLQSGLRAASGKWGLAEEIRTWPGSFHVPSFEDMQQMLFSDAPRFQMMHLTDVYINVTLRSLAEWLVAPPSLDSSRRLSRILLNSSTRLESSRRLSFSGLRSSARSTEASRTNISTAKASRSGGGEQPNSPMTRTKTSLFVQSELTQQSIPILKPRGGRSYHVYCSESNTGAIELMKELADNRKLDQQLKTTSRENEIKECEHFLVYLTKLTWTQPHSEVFAKEVLEALRHGVHLLLVHEVPSPFDDSERNGIRFDAFFNSEDGVTPNFLLMHGIYDEVACPLMGSIYRDESMALLHTVVATELKTSSGGFILPLLDSFPRTFPFARPGFIAPPEGSCRSSAASTVLPSTRITTRSRKDTPFGMSTRTRLSSVGRPNASSVGTPACAPDVGLSDTAQGQRHATALSLFRFWAMSRNSTQPLVSTHAQERLIPTGVLKNMFNLPDNPVPSALGAMRRSLTAELDVGRSNQNVHNNSSDSAVRSVRRKAKTVDLGVTLDSWRSSMRLGNVAGRVSRASRRVSRRWSMGNAPPKPPTDPGDQLDDEEAAEFQQPTVDSVDSAEVEESARRVARRLQEVQAELRAMQRTRSSR